VKNTHYHHNRPQALKLLKYHAVTQRGYFSTTGTAQAAIRFNQPSTNSGSVRVSRRAWPASGTPHERHAVAVGDPIERWLEMEGVSTIPGFGDVELAGDLDWEPGVGLVYLRRLNDSRVWRAGITVTARPRRWRCAGRAAARTRRKGRRCRRCGPGRSDQIGR
jgi:hypothetical protein